jgi:hypothetical protein
VPGGALITQALIDQGVLPRGTKYAQAGKAITDIVVGAGQVFIGADGAIIGGGMSLTGAGAVAGVPVCVGSLALAANGAVTFYNGVKSLTIVLCRWEDEPAAGASAESSASAAPAPTTAPPPAAKPMQAPPAAKLAQGAKPAAKPAQTSPAAITETKTTTQYKSTGKTVSTKPSGTTTATQPKGPPKAAKPVATAPVQGQFTPRNKALAGKKHPVTGVPFDMDGYPDFRAAGVVKAEVKIKMTGAKKDFADADKLLGYPRPQDYMWHHHQDCTTMQLVPKKIHQATGHTGGSAILKHQSGQ